MNTGTWFPSALSAVEVSRSGLCVVSEPGRGVHRSVQCGSRKLLPAAEVWRGPGSALQAVPGKAMLTQWRQLGLRRVPAIDSMSTP